MDICERRASLALYYIARVKEYPSPYAYRWLCPHVPVGRPHVSVIPAPAPPGHRAVVAGRRAPRRRCRLGARRAHASSADAPPCATPPCASPRPRRRRESRRREHGGGGFRGRGARRSGWCARRATSPRLAQTPRRRQTLRRARVRPPRARRRARRAPRRSALRFARFAPLRRGRVLASARLRGHAADIVLSPSGPRESPRRAPGAPRLAVRASLPGSADWT